METRSMTRDGSPVRDAKAEAREVKARKAQASEAAAAECRSVLTQALTHNAKSEKGLSFPWLRDYASEFTPSQIRTALATMEWEGVAFKDSRGKWWMA